MNTMNSIQYNEYNKIKTIIQIQIETIIKFKRIKIKLNFTDFECVGGRPRKIETEIKLFYIFLFIQQFKEYSQHFYMDRTQSCKPVDQNPMQIFKQAPVESVYKSHYTEPRVSFYIVFMSGCR